MRSIVRTMMVAMRGGANEIQLEQARATGELEEKFKQIVNHVASLHRANQTDDDDDVNGFINELEGLVAKCKQKRAAASNQCRQQEQTEKEAIGGFVNNWGQFKVTLQEMWDKTDNEETMKHCMDHFEPSPVVGHSSQGLGQPSAPVAGHGKPSAPPVAACETTCCSGC